MDILELKEKVTPAIIKKAASRLEKDKAIANQYSFEQVLQFESGNFEVLGLFRDNKSLILCKGKKYYTMAIVENVKKSKGTKEKNEPKPKAEIKLERVCDLKYDPSIFIPMKTKKPIDYIFSSEGGVFPGTNYILIGDPGIGKSTQALDILVQVQKVDKSRKVLFISGEMNQIDMYGYCKRYKEFGKIPTLFLSDYLDNDIEDVLNQVLDEAWDLVLIDSFAEVQETWIESGKLTRNACEKKIVDLMIKHNKGKNSLNKYTAFIAIQQVTKGGVQLGSNKLKHNTTGSFEIRYSSEFSGDRYIKVTKNRRGFKHEKIFFSLDNNKVEYDEKRLNRDIEIKVKLTNEKEHLLSEEEKFNKIFEISS